MYAVILAAGKGTRLAPLTNTTRKPLIDIDGIPILGRIINELPSGITSIIVVVEHLEDKIRNYFGNAWQGRPITYVRQGPMKGTYGALRAAQPILDSSRFLVMGADDIFSQTDIALCLKEKRAFGTTQTTPPRKKFFTIETDTDGNVQNLHYPNPEETTITLATGLYVLDHHIWEYEPVPISNDEFGLPQTILKMAPTYPIKAVTMAFWLPINTHEQLAHAREYLLRKQRA